MDQATRRRSAPSLAPALDGSERTRARHLAQLYHRDRFLLDAAERFLVEGLAAGDGALAVATRDHLRRLGRRLRRRGLDPDALAARGRLVVADAGEALARIMRDGAPDPGRFHDVVGGLVRRASARRTRHVRAFGEMVTILVASGPPDGAARLEALWNDLLEREALSLLCGYPLGLFPRTADTPRFAALCAAHAEVLPAETYPILAGAADRLRAVSELQQQAGALQAEAAERRAAEALLEQQHEELAEFLENAAEGLHRVGPDRRILWANQALLALLGYAAEEYVGQPAAAFHADPEVFEGVWERLQRREAVRDQPGRLRCRDGSTRHVLINAAGAWTGGAFRYARCFIRDITEQRRLEDELRGRIAELAALDRRKDEFLAMLGHELRNPLSALQNALALLAADLPPERRAQAFRIARRQTDQLARLVDDLLDVARVTRGRVSLRQHPISLASVVERAVESTRPLFEGRLQTLALQAPAEPLTVHGDAARLEQVVVNLLSNAAKYTAPGGRIEVMLERREREAVLHVRDEGVGIAPDVLPRVFDLFAQGPQAPHRPQGGLGIGLTVVRRLVELHGGRVEARSAGAGQGSTFVVSLPLARAADARPRERRPETQGAHRSLDVLVVEDNPDAAETLVMLLELLGHRARVLGDGPGAVDAARERAPDVMLVDIGLPGMDGYEVARRVRQEPGLAGIRLIALTGYGRPEDRSRAAAAGFDHHLVKPVEIAALDAMLGQGRARAPRIGAGD